MLTYILQQSEVFAAQVPMLFQVQAYKAPLSSATRMEQDRPVVHSCSYICVCPKRVRVSDRFKKPADTRQKTHILEKSHTDNAPNKNTPHRV